MADREAFVPRHAITSELTAAGLKPVMDQAVTEETVDRAAAGLVPPPKAKAAKSTTSEPAPIAPAPATADKE